MAAPEPPADPQRVVVLAEHAGPGGDIAFILCEFPPGCTGSQVRAYAQMMTTHFPGRLLAAEHQNWWHDRQAWTRYLWFGGSIQADAEARDRLALSSPSGWSGPVPPKKRRRKKR